MQPTPFNKEAIPCFRHGMASCFHQWSGRQWSGRPARFSFLMWCRRLACILLYFALGMAFLLLWPSRGQGRSASPPSAEGALHPPVTAQREAVIPPESVIWWRFDPTSLSRRPAAPNAPDAPPDRALNLNSRLASAILRAAVASKVVQSGPVARVLEVALAAGEAGAAPHTLAVLELSEVEDTSKSIPSDTPGGANPRRVRSGGTPGPLIRLKAVLDLETARGHQELLRTIEAILVDPNLPQADRGTQRQFTVPGGSGGSGANGRRPDRTIAAFRGPEWPDSLEVSWCSTPGHFTVAVGVGAMERWFAVQDAPPPTVAAHPSGASSLEEAAAHRRYMDRLRSSASPADGPDASQATGQRSTSAFEFFMDCNALRRSMDGSFTSSLRPETEGRGARLLRSWSLSNARSFMLHARVIAPENVVLASGLDDLPALLDPAAKRSAYDGPPLLVMDATWSSRSDAIGDVSHRAVSQPFWPQKDMGKPPAPTTGAFVMVFPSDLSSLLDVTTGFHSGLVSQDDARRHDRADSAWQRKMSGVIQRQRQRLGKWIVLIGPESPGGSALADLAILCPLDQRADHRQFDTDLLSLLTPFKDHIHAADGNIRTLSADSLGAMNLAAWTTLPRDKDNVATFIAALGFGLTQDAAKNRVKRLSEWFTRDHPMP